MGACPRIESGAGSELAEGGASLWAKKKPLAVAGKRVAACRIWSRLAATVAPHVPCQPHWTDLKGFGDLTPIEAAGESLCKPSPGFQGGVGARTYICLVGGPRSSRSVFPAKAGIQRLRPTLLLKSPTKLVQRSPSIAGWPVFSVEIGHLT